MKENTSGEAYFVETDYEVDDIYTLGWCSRCHATMRDWMDECPECGAKIADCIDYAEYERLRKERHQ